MKWRVRIGIDQKDINVLSVEKVGKGVLIGFSDGTESLFQSHFLYKVRNDDGNIELTQLSEDELLEGLDNLGNVS